MDLMIFLLIFASPLYMITFRNITDSLTLTKGTQCTDRHLFGISNWLVVHLSNLSNGKPLTPGGILTQCRPWSSSN